MKMGVTRSLVTLTAISMLAVTGGSAAQAAGVGVALDNKQVAFQVEPYVKNGQTMVQLRALAEALGGSVTWNGATQEVAIHIGDALGVVKIGGMTVVVNDQQFALGEKAELKNGATMVPVRLFEKFGAAVEWDAQKNQVVVSSKGKKAVLNLSLQDEIGSMDPAKSMSWDAFSVIAQTNEGLVRLDEAGYPVAGAANAWEVTPDSKTYTFHLRKDAKWSDGSQVTAGDFEYAWKRSLDANMMSQWAFLLMDIEGAEDYHLGKQTADAVGVKAIDDRTLQVKLKRPLPYFAEMLAHPIFYPVKMSFAQRVGTGFGQDPDKVLSNGPFVLTEWEHEGMMKLQKNKHYWDADAVKLDTVNYMIVNDLAARENLYKQGVLDRIALNQQELIEAYKGTAEYNTAAEGIVHYLSFNTGKPGINNVLVRQALAYAIDLETAADIQGDNDAATGFVPSGITNFGKDFREVGGDLIKQKENAAKAKALLAEGLKQMGMTELPAMSLLVDDSISKKKLAEQITADWKKNLGVEIKVEAVPFKFRLQRSHAADFDIVVSGWAADYNDAATFLDMFGTTNDFNVPKYGNPNYDLLLKKAEEAADLDVRIEALHEAEELLMNDMPVAPLYFSNKAYLTKPYVKGLHTHAYPSFYDLKDVYVEGR